MDIINIHHCKRCIDVEVNISNQRFVFLKYGTASEPLPDYLPIKVLPLDQDGFGKYELPCKNMIPEAATHIWVSSEDAEHNIALAPIPNKQELPTPNPNFVFYAISDIHTICKSGKQLRLQAEAFQHISDAGAAFVLIAGDLSNGVQAAEYSIMSQQIENRLAGIPVLQTFGNHDFHPNQPEDIPDHQSRMDFRNWLIERNRSYGVSCDYYDEYNYSTTIGGIHIVSLQGVDYKDKIYSVVDDALSWLDSVLSKHSGEKQIVFCHYPLTDDTGRIYLRENTKVKQILERHGNILYFAGHTHDSLDSDIPSIRQNGTVTYINTASIGNTEPCPRNIRELKFLRNKKQHPSIEDYFRRKSMGIRVDVYSSSISIRGMDFIHNKFVPLCNRKIIKYGGINHG